jgi:hypothetical protein
MNEQTTHTTTVEAERVSNDKRLSRLSILRPLWWILQGFIIGVWKVLLTFVLVWQALHIFFKGELHTWSTKFTKKFINHVLVWTQYTFWITDEEPDIIEY